MCFIYCLSVCWMENNFIKKKKHVLCAFITWWKTRQSLWEFASRWKPSTATRVFTDLLLNSSKHSPQFSPGHEGTENMFYFLIVYDKLNNIITVIITEVNKERLVRLRVECWNTWLGCWAQYPTEWFESNNC